jgi:hypothetical protein
LDANNNGVCDLWEDVLPCVGPSCCDDGTAWDDSLGRCVIAEPAYLNAPGELAILNPCYFDSDQDGLVSTTDLLNVLSVYGMSCPE